MLGAAVDPNGPSKFCRPGEGRGPIFCFSNFEENWGPAGLRKLAGTTGLLEFELTLALEESLALVRIAAAFWLERRADAGVLLSLAGLRLTYS